MANYTVFGSNDPLCDINTLHPYIDSRVVRMYLDKDLNHICDNAYAIHQDTFCLFYTLARQLQKYFYEKARDVKAADQYLKYAKLCLRQCSTVDCNLVGAHSKTVDINGEWELWLADQDFSVDERLGRLYCLVVQYLLHPDQFEQNYKKNYN